jgi:hypothetical protein
VGRALGAALLLALCAGAPRVALAADPPATAKADTSKQAQQLLDEGLVAIKLGQWEKARSFLLGAWRLQQHWRIAPHLANVELKLGRMRDAAEHLSFFLREGKNLDPGDRKQAETLLARAQAKIGTVNVGGAPAGAEIRVDGELVGTAPLAGPIFVEPGTRRVEARAEGYATAERVVTLGPGQEGRVEVGLAAVPRAVGPVAGAGGGAGGAGPVKNGPNMGVVAAGVTGTVAALGLGVGFLVASAAKNHPMPAPTDPAYSACKMDPSGCAYNGTWSEHNTFGNAGVYSLVVGGALGVGTLIYGLVPRRQAGDVKVAVVAGPSGGGAAVTMVW